MSDGDAAGEDLASLRRRLAEAEETLRAIREGEVDALVVQNQSRDAVFALGGGDESYRAFMEAMDLGAAALDGQRRLIYANAVLCKLLDRSFEELELSGLTQAMGPECAGVLDQMLHEVPEQRRSVQALLTCTVPHRHLEITVAPLPLSFGQGYALTFADVTQRVEAQAAEELELIGRAIMTSFSEAVVVCDEAGRVTHANSAVRRFRDESPVGQLFAEAFPLQFPVGSGLMGIEDLLDVALAGNSLRDVEAVSDALKARDLLVNVSPLQLVGGVPGGCVVNLIDLTARKAVEQRQKLLMGELAHRVKNTLTLVLSISSRTVAGARDLQDFRTTFARRIEALAATHNLLAEDAWNGLTLEDLVNAELAPYVSLGSGRARLTLPGVRIASDTAVALGLIFHELVTNAVKYGALSNDTGVVAISAHRNPEGALELVWQEEGGPPVAQPEKRGFGQTVIARGLGTANGAATRVEFRPEGLVCQVRVPATALL